MQGQSVYNCFDEFSKLYQLSNNISVANVISAVELSTDEAEKLKKSLEKRTGKRLTLNCVIDADIIGGVIAEIDGVIYDGSIKRRLSEIKKVIDT